ncbi:hypothetical protein T03_6307 [Trichinella britovi]|uniref:Uncharacterized protein n=1 Tax=Trichinella britovi TaxID=45882 RepID=A0A0V0Z2C5_TRIBR|nr:hypothetical protein T03_6307 [Trichinella britovi]
MSKYYNKYYSKADWFLINSHLHKRNRIMMDKAKMRSNNNMCGINQMPNE